MKEHIPPQYVIHGFRHAMRDRLREVDCPADVMDENWWLVKAVSRPVLWQRFLSGEIAWVHGAGSFVQIKGGFNASRSNFIFEHKFNEIQQTGLYYKTEME